MPAMPSFLSLPFYTPVEFFPFSPLRFKPYPPSFIPLSSFRSQNPIPNFCDDYDDHVIGDCLVFEDDAFDDPIPSSHPAGTPSCRSPSPETLVPDKWKKTLDELKLTKKEKRKISHQLRFASKLERKKKSPIPSLEEYEAYRELKLSQLKPVFLDEPKAFGDLKEEMEVVGGRRVSAVNPRLGLREGSLEDIRGFFNSGEYVPGKALDDDKKPQGDDVEGD